MKYAYDKGEQPREKLWRILVNNARGLNARVSGELITHLLDNIHKYSLIEKSDIGIGLRDNIAYFLTRLLNDCGWADPAGKHSENSETNIREIAEWIFDEERHAGNGVLKKLSDPDRGVLGLYDLMVFRLYCSADRGGDIFDLTRALSKHGDENAPIQGDTRVIAREEMREISQKVFQIFKTQYIDGDKNIFDEVEQLQLKQLAGEYSDYIESQIKKGLVERDDVDKEIKRVKNAVLVFILYQLGNDFMSSGVGCGYYDQTGKEDKQQIKGNLNDYLFDFCFNPKNGEKNYEHFIDYLIRNYASVLESPREGGRKYIAEINEFTKVLDKAKLANYWQTYATNIKTLNLQEKEKVLFVGNYTASYKEDLQAVYKVLDDHVSEVARARPVVKADQALEIPTDKK